MSNPVSLFIMDVSDSSYNNIGEELSSFLGQIVDWVNVWTNGIVQTKIKHRMGDEIIFISNDYSTAYTIAFYISRIWKFKDNKPYFGLTFGDIDKEIGNLDIETWIHPLIKHARTANDDLKKEFDNRHQFNFEINNYNLPNEQTNLDNFKYEFETLLNSLLRFQQNYIMKQTELQDLICSLYLIFMQQKKIATYLDKTASTISHHLKKGNGEEILNSFSVIQKVLNSLQTSVYKNENDYNPLIINEKLNKRIKSHISDNTQEIFGTNNRI